MTLTRLVSRIAPVSVVLAALVCIAPQSAMAQAPTAPTRIAVVNTPRIFNEIQEYKALKQKLADESKRLDGIGQERQRALQKMQEDRNANYRPGTPQYDDVNVKIMADTADLKVWVELEKAKLDFSYKKQLKALFDKVQAAVAEVAKRDGYDLVLATSGEQVPDDLTQVDMRTLSAMLFQRNVLFTNDKNDLTSTIILVLDSKYKQAAGTANTGGK